MSKEKIIEAAEKFIKAGKIDKAIKEYKKLVSENPTDMRTKLKLGELHAKNKELPVAIQIFREVAETYTKENFHLKAIAVYKNMLKIAPTLIEMNEKLGDLYHKVGLEADAINQYYIVASYYDSKGMTKEAMGVRRRIVDIDPSNTTGRIRLAELMQSQGSVEESMEQYEKAAALLEKSENPSGLSEILEKIVHARPTDIKTLLKLCKVYFEKREFKKALKKIESTHPEIKNHPELQEVWAEALIEDHQIDAARNKFRDLYQQSLEEKDKERASRIYSRAIKEFSDDEEYLAELERMKRESGLNHTVSKAAARQDLEKTQMIDLGQLEKLKKK